MITKEAAKQWANSVGITGKRGSTYLYCGTGLSEGGLELYKPWFYSQAIQGYQHLADILNARDAEIIGGRLEL